MGCIFRPEALSWEDIDGGRGEMTMEAIRNFISEYCYPDEYADYGDDEELPNELVFFAEMWERLDGYYTPISDSFQTAAVLSLIDGAFFDSMAADRIAEKLTKSATKPDLVPDYYARRKRLLLVCVAESACRKSKRRRISRNGEKKRGEMVRQYRYIDFQDRKEISTRYLNGDRVADIADGLGVTTATVYRELKRGETGGLDRNQRRAYNPVLAQQRVQENFKRRGKTAVNS